MLQKLFIFLSILLSFNLVMAAEEQLFQCEFLERADFSLCSGPNQDFAYYATGDEVGGELLNAKIGISDTVPAGYAGQGDQYTHGLCCTSGYEVGIDYNYRLDGERCLESEFEFGFLNSPYNSKLHLNYSTNYDNSICLETTSEDFASLDIKIGNEDTSSWQAVGFDCMYRFGSGYSSYPSQTSNGKVSSCDAQYLSTSGSYEQYPFMVFARLIPNIQSSTCNSDCTSRVDGRVYSACGDVIQQCQAVPPECDGSIVGEWVRYDSDRDVLCDMPYNQYRETQRSSEDLIVESEENICQDIIVEQYNVLVDRETVTMNVYICND